MDAKNKPKKLVEGRIDISYHRYRIVGGRREGTSQAIAYLGRRKLHEETGETVEAAVSALKRALDQHVDRLVQERVDGVPSEAEFREALLALGAVVPMDAMGLLIEHSRLSGAVATLGDLARRSGRDEESTATEYARLGRKVGSLLNFAPESNELERSLAPLLTFSVIERLSVGAAVKLRLRPEVLAALGATSKGDMPD